jgi:hypothetical protein
MTTSTTPGSPPIQPNENLTIDIPPQEGKKTQSTPPKTPPGEKSLPGEGSHNKGESRQVSQGEFEPEQHFYPRVLNAQIHPLIQSFFTLGNERIIARYTHLNPQVKPEVLKGILSYTPTHFQWAGRKKFHLFVCLEKKVD